MATPPKRPRRRIAGERRSAAAPVPAEPGTAEQPTRPTTRSSGTPDPGSAVLLDKSPPRKREAAPAGTEPRVRRRPRARRTAGEPSSGWWGSTASLLALGVALLVLVVLVGLGALGWLGNDGFQELNDEDAVQRSAETAPAAAERAAAAILAYDYRSLEADRDAATRFMSDDLAKQYVETFDKVVTPAALDTNARVTAEVKASSVIRAGEDQVRVLLFVDQTTRSTSNANPQLALNRVEFIMVDEDDTWRVDEITSY